MYYFETIGIILFVIIFASTSKSKNKVCAIYCRASTDESRQDVQIQLECQIEWCESNKYNYIIYVDYISGIKKVEGKQLKQLKNDVKARKVNIISIYKLDRLTRRGISHGLNIIQYFREYGVTVRSHTEDFLDDKLPEHTKELILSTMLWASRLESEKTSDRIKSAYDLKKKQAQNLECKVDWGRKPGTFQINIDIEKLREFIVNNPKAGYGRIAKEFTYWDSKSRKQKIPSRSAIKARLIQLGVRKIIVEDPNGKKVPKWVWEKTTD